MHMPEIPTPTPAPAAPTSDHDMLVGLNVKMDYVTRNLRDLNDGVSTRLTDIDNRVRAVEKTNESFATVKTIVYSLVSLILVGVVGALLSLVIRQQ